MFYTAPESSYYYEYLHPLIQFHNFLKIPVKKPQTTLIVRNRLLLDSFAVDLSKIYPDFFLYIYFSDTHVLGPYHRQHLHLHRWLINSTIRAADQKGREVDPKLHGSSAAICRFN